MRGALPLRSGGDLAAALVVRRSGAGPAPVRGEGVRLPPAEKGRDRAPWGAQRHAGSGGQACADARRARTARTITADPAEKMAGMPPLPAPRPPGFSRRTLLAASAAGLAVLAAGCSSPPTDEREQVTSEQADRLAAQVTVQQTLVAAFAAAGTADPALAASVAELAGQAAEQLERLEAAAPGSTASAAASTEAPPPAPDTRGWLRAQVAAAATSHAAACLDQSGARAALLGSIAAGLRGQEARLA